MNYKAIKKGFKLLTVATIISSIVGCSSTQKQPYVYKEELQEFKSTEKLPEGVLETKSKDGSIIRMVVDKNSNVTLITKDSISYDNILECKRFSGDDYKSLKKSLESNSDWLKEENNIEYKYASNKEFKIVVKNCYEDIDKYKYDIQITPKEPTKKTTKQITHSIVDTMGAVVAAPFMLVGLIVAIIVVTPIYVYFNFIYKPNS